MFRPMTILAVFIFLQSTQAWADAAMDMKQEALKACESQEVIMTEFQKRSAIQQCKCVAEKTDYKIVIEGDEVKIKDEEKKNKVACALKGAM